MHYHVFLSHGSADKPAVEELARRLAKEGIQVWLDKWNLIPGEAWQPAIEKALGDCETCAVFVGPGNFGPWQNEEMRVAIDRRVRDSQRRFHVIPVLLPGATRAERSSLPTFLAATTWAEFHNSLDDPEAFHRLVCGIRGIEPGAGPGQALYEGQCPYRGLRVFDVEDAPFFFGREALVEWLLNELRPATIGKPVNRFLAIVGASGSGKSSLARAGSVAALKRNKLPGSSAWPVAICRPGPDPLESLAVALSRAVNVGHSASALAELIAEFQKNEKTLHLIARRSLPDNAPDVRLVVLIDQFEEVFTLCHKEELREALMRNLLYAAKVAQGQTLVILTMRADFYAKCAANAELAAAFSDHHLLVGPMTDEELCRAIERPALLVGGELEAGLVDLLVRDVHKQPGALPLLQHALLELWDKREGRRLTVRAYQEIGKLEGALQRRADATLMAFSAEEHELCRRTFLRLTQPGEGTEDTKRRASMQELLSLSKESAAEEEIVQKLATASLLTTEGDLSGKDASVEVAHEALVRSWPQLRKWIDADRAGLCTRTRLTEAAREWKNAGRDLTYLYQGARLAVAEEWAGSHPGELSGEEAEFLKCSLEAQQQREANELAAAQRLGRAESARAEEADRRRQQLRRLAWMLALVALAAAAAAIFGFWQKRQAEKQTVLAREAEQEKAGAGGRANVSSAQYLLEDSKDVLALAYLAQALRLDRRNESAGVLTGAMLSLDSWAIPVAGPMRHDEAVFSAQFSADGQRVVTASYDKTAQVWDAASGKAIGQPMRHEDAVISAQFSADGQRVVTASEDKTARVWDAASGKAIGQPMRHEDAVNSAQFSADGQRVVTASLDKTAQVWDAASGNAIGQPMRHEDAVNSAQFSADGQRVVTASEDKTARVWDAASGKAIGQPMRHEGWVRSAQFSADGQRVVTASEDNTAQVWDAASGNAIGQPMRHEDAVISAQFSADGQRVVTASLDNTARVWDAASGKAIGEPIRHEGWVYSAQFSSDGQRVVTASKDNTAQVWDAAIGNAIEEPLRHGDAVISAHFSADGQRVVTASRDNTARLWDATTGRPIGEPMKHAGPVNSAQFSADGQRVVTASEDKTARLWDATTGRPIGEPMKHAGPVNSAQFSADGQRVLTASKDNTAQVWDAASGKAIGQPMRHEGWVRSAQFSADGQRVVTASEDNTAQVWDAASGKAIGQPMRHEDAVYSAQFSSDGQRVVTASYDKTAQVWDAASGKAILQQPLRPDGQVISAHFSSDGRWVVTASRDNKTAQVWDAANGTAIGQPMRHEGAVYSAQFSADGQRVVTASEDKTAQVWDAASGKAIGQPMRHDQAVFSAHFSADGQRVVTASKDKTARVWDVPTIGNQDTPDDVELLAELAEAACGSVLQTSGQAEILKRFPPDQVIATREKIAAKFERRSSGLTPVERLLKWSVADPRRRTISPFSKLTVPEWIENRIKEGTYEGLRTAIQMDPANPRLGAHFGRALADHALANGTDPDEPRRARAEADYQTRRAVKLAPDNDDVKKLRAEVVKLLNLPVE